MAETVELSESALSLLRRRVEGNDDVTEENRPAYRFTEKGWARRFELIAANPDPSPVASHLPRG